MKLLFGKTKDGQDVTLYTLENNHIVMKVMDYGATLVSFIHKDTGIDTVLGFATFRGYLEQTSYIGASIGRTANRIEKGTFTLHGKTYHIPCNNNGNANHGGLEGFDKKLFKTVVKSDRIIFTYVSKDGEEGYPGNLTVTITYILKEDGIEIEADGNSNEDTLFAYTNHSYFNLDESDSILQHKVKIESDTYALSDANGLTQNILQSVKDTPFDFTQSKEIGKDINAEDIQLKYGAGYDHYFPIQGNGMRKMVTCTTPKLQLVISSDLPGMHMYTGNWLENKMGKRNRMYPPRSGVAFEPEYMPNAINYENQIQPIVKKDTHVTHRIRYQLIKQ